MYCHHKNQSSSINHSVTIAVTVLAISPAISFFVQQNSLINWLTKVAASWSRSRSRCPSPSPSPRPETKLQTPPCVNINIHAHPLCGGYNIHPRYLGPPQGQRPTLLDPMLLYPTICRFRWTPVAAVLVFILFFLCRIFLLMGSH